MNFYFINIFSASPCFGNYDLTVMLDRYTKKDQSTSTPGDPTAKFIELIEGTIQLLNVEQNKSHFGLVTFKRTNAEVQYM